MKHRSMLGAKLLIVQLMMADGKTGDGEPVLAIDALGAGIGDTVLMTSDGSAVQDIVNDKTTPVRWSVMGVPD
jgi:ethanolamine utilization protein EutN